jgi:sortase A
MTAVEERTEPTSVQEPADPSRLARLRARLRRDAKPRRPRSAGTLITAGGLLGLGVLALWFVFYCLVLSSLVEWHSQRDLYSSLRQQLAEQTAPLGGIVAAGSPVAVLNIPGAGLKSVVVVEGTGSGDLMKGPGHRRDTPLPGQAGVSVLYGRASMFGGPFSRVADLRVGAPITFTTGQGAFTYLVSGVRHVGDPYPQPLTAGQGRLTLVTAQGSGWRSGWAPSTTVYVDATLQGKAVGTPPGGLTAVPRAEQALRGDNGALIEVVLWLFLLFVASGSLVWAHERWGLWQTWIVGLPALLACLWGVAQTAVQLLPNLM